MVADHVALYDDILYRRTNPVRSVPSVSSAAFATVR
jgi:hypothetical protein